MIGCKAPSKEGGTIARPKHLPQTLTRQEAAFLLAQPSRRYPTGSATGPSSAPSTGLACAVGGGGSVARYILPGPGDLPNPVSKAGLEQYHTHVKNRDVNYVLGQAIVELQAAE